MGWFWQDDSTNAQNSTNNCQGEQDAGGQDEEIVKLNKSIAKVKGELEQSKRQGLILQKYRSDELYNAQKKYQVHIDHWIGIKACIIENRNILLYSPDYGAVIKQVFAEYQKDNPNDTSEDYDRSKSLTWFCREEIKLCRAMHYETICENILLPLLTNQYHKLKSGLKTNVSQIREEEGIMESIHLSTMSNTHVKQQQVKETYDYYIELQEHAIATLKNSNSNSTSNQTIMADEQQKQNHDGASSLATTTATTEGVSSDILMSPTSNAKQRVTENRKKREEYLKNETAKRRAVMSPVRGTTRGTVRAGRGLSSSRARANNNTTTRGAAGAGTGRGGGRNNTNQRNGVVVSETVQWERIPSIRNLNASSGTKGENSNNNGEQTKKDGVDDNQNTTNLSSVQESKDGEKAKADAEGTATTTTTSNAVTAATDNATRSQTRRNVTRRAGRGTPTTPSSTRRTTTRTQASPYRGRRNVVGRNGAPRVGSDSPNNSIGSIGSVPDETE